MPASIDELRPHLMAIAYRMLGSVSDAEDLVQEAFARYERARREGVEVTSPKAYLSATVTRLAIDELRSARRHRETYVGAWLPEPLVTHGPDEDTALADSLTMAFLCVLETLDPVSRAVFLLHDVFGRDFEEIAPLVDKSAANCRQIAVRARRRVEEKRPHLEPSRHRREQLAAEFFAALSAGDEQRLVRLLAADAVVHGDGGGKAPQWAGPITGAARAARLLTGLARKYRHVTLHRAEINGQPGALVRDARGDLINVFAIDIADGVVRTVRSVINPDKLRHLGPLADLRAIMREG